MTMAVWLSGRAGRGRHPSDDDLTMLALAGVHADDALVAAHVRECAACAERMTRLEDALARERDARAAEADQWFTRARLDQQRAAILRRIGGARSGARVLAFPVQIVTDTLRRRHAVRRYVAAAAVAGLLVGAVAGRLFDSRVIFSRTGSPAADRVTLQPGAGIEARQSTAVTDEAFLREFETAIGAPRVEALRTLDELTPLPVDQVASR